MYRVDGNTRRIVPKPADRAAIVAETHRSTGHWGARRTTALLELTYWWPGLADDAKLASSTCAHCTRIKASFNAHTPELNPLSVEGFCYRWGVDLAGPFTPTVRGHKYLFIAIEHYTKDIVAVPIPNKDAATVAYTFLHHVLARFGSCAEVLTDQGKEFEGEFDELLRTSLIDHRITSAYHPQTNGLAERAVQSLKRALRKLASERENPGGSASWDEQVPWVLLGYRASPQQSTKYSPMHLLYARDPVIPPGTVERLREPLQLGDEEAAAASLLARAEYLK